MPLAAHSLAEQPGRAVAPAQQPDGAGRCGEPAQAAGGGEEEGRGALRPTQVSWTRCMCVVSCNVITHDLGSRRVSDGCCELQRDHT